MATKTRQTPSSESTPTVSSTGQNASSNGLGNAGLLSLFQTLNGPDIQREGRFTDPRDPSQSVSVEQMVQRAKDQDTSLGHQVMQHAFQPEQTQALPKEGMRLFVPGLNTPEPEASRRTQEVARILDQPMAHMHNGTHLEADLPHADQIDYVVALMTRMGIKSSPLIDELVRLMTANFEQDQPEPIHAILYSDSTIAGTQAISRFREEEIRNRIAKRSPSQRRSARTEVSAEVDALLRKYLFVELHGNAVADLPQGPRYLVWTDTEDPISHRELPFTDQTFGLHGQQRDDNPDAIYVDYDGPFRNFDAHNLAAGGAYVVEATLRLNGVETPQELHEKAQAGEKILVPQNVKGNPKELWNPHNQ